MPKLLRCVLPSSYTEDVPQYRFGDQGLDEAFMPSPLDLGQSLNHELLYDERDEDSVLGSPASSGKQVARSLNSPNPDAEHSYSVRHSGIGIIGEDGVASSVRQRLHNHPRIQSLRQNQANSFWFKSAVLSTTTPVSVGLILLVLGGCIPFMIACTHLKHTIDESQLLPRGSEAVEVFQQVQDYLSPGIVANYQVSERTKQCWRDWLVLVRCTWLNCALVCHPVSSAC
jgi:hypothetical protein